MPKLIICLITCALSLTIIHINGMERIHKGIIMNHNVGCYHKTQNLNIQPHSLPSLLSLKFFHFKPNARERIPHDPLPVIELNRTDDTTNNYLISHQISSCIGRAWDLEPVGHTVSTLNEVLNTELEALDPHAYAFRSTFRCPWTQIDINYDPFARTVQVVTVLLPERSAPFFETIGNITSDRLSRIDESHEDPTTGSKRVRIVTECSLVELASLLDYSDKLD